MFFWIDSSAAFCFSFFILSSLIFMVDSPGIYSISPAFAACLRDSSLSAEHGIIMRFGNSCFNFSRFSFALGLSILFAAIIIGFVKCLNVFANFLTSSSDHSAGFSGFSFVLMRVCLMSPSFTFKPENCLAISFARSFFVV